MKNVYLWLVVLHSHTLKMKRETVISMAMARIRMETAGPIPNVTYYPPVNRFLYKYEEYDSIKDINLDLIK